MSSGVLSGKLALVTGAGSGLGRATCQLLAREGATVVAADRNYDAAVDTIKQHTVLAAQCKDEHSALEVDVSSSSSVQSAVETTLKQYRRPPTVVVNMAGVTRDNLMLKMSEMDYDIVMDVNLKGTFLVMQAFSKAMVDAAVAGGSIINASSIVARYGNIGQTNYAASKTGIIGMTQSAAKELGRYNIRVNAVLPGFTNTAMVKTIPDKVMAKMLQSVALGRLGEPSEIAEVVVFLASDKSSFVTGASIDIAGGL